RHGASDLVAVAAPLRGGPAQRLALLPLRRRPRRRYCGEGHGGRDQDACFGPGHRYPPLGFLAGGPPLLARRASANHSRAGGSIEPVVLGPLATPPLASSGHAVRPAGRGGGG